MEDAFVPSRRAGPPSPPGLGVGRGASRPGPQQRSDCARSRWSSKARRKQKDEAGCARSRCPRLPSRHTWMEVSMRVLIAYATTEGQTRKIATTIAGQVRGQGHDVRLVDIASKPSDVHPDDFDAIIIAASVHQEKHQEDIEAFVSASKNVLATKPTMFVSISLAAAFEEGREDAERYIASFKRTAAGNPTRAWRSPVPCGAMNTTTTNSRFLNMSFLRIAVSITRNRIMSSRIGKHFPAPLMHFSRTNWPRP